METAEKDFGANTKLIKLKILNSAPAKDITASMKEPALEACSISEMDPEDGMTEVHRGLVPRADVILVATPIRWGNASSLYFKMCERLNCVQNQITLNDKILIKNKVAGFIITGGQDNIQHVAGVMSCFFTDLGFSFPPFNFVGWSRGWTSEDMEHNVEQFVKSRYIKRSVKELVTNSINMSINFKKMDCMEIDSPLPKRRDIGNI
ncbi:MAG: NAD(P)H-dependent oxidoreductase [Ignavibacteria bacterium]